MVIIRTEKELKPRDKHDHYPTPLALCEVALSLLPDDTYQWVLDPGAGQGPWGIAARSLWPQSYIVGVELNEYTCPISSIYDEWHKNNFLAWHTGVLYSMVIGNPPYRLAQQFVDKSLSMVGEGGCVMFLLRLAFLESRRRYEWWREGPLKNVWVLANRPSFTSDGHTDETAYALYLWEKGYDQKPVLDWLYWGEGYVSSRPV